MIDADPFWQDKTTGEPCPTRGHRLCTVTDPEHRHVAIPTPPAHVYAPRCTSVYVPMGAATTLMSYSRPGTAAALAEDPEEARRVMEKVRAASDQIRQCIHDAPHRSLPHRSEDGMEWRDDDPDDDPDDDEPVTAAAEDERLRLVTESASERARRVVEESEARLCECNRPDEHDNPHRHERDDWCALWADATTDPSTLFKVAWVAQARNTLARDALVQTGHFTEEQVSDDVAPRITELRAHHESIVADLCDAIRLTAEYANLPAVEGWSWYDALRKHAPDAAERARVAWSSASTTAGSLRDDEGFDLQPGITQIRVVPCDGLWWKWRADITFRGADVPSVYARTADRAEERARARLHDLRAEYARHTGTARIIDLTDEEH